MFFLLPPGTQKCSHDLLLADVDEVTGLNLVNGKIDKNYVHDKFIRAGHFKPSIFLKRVSSLVIDSFLVTDFSFKICFT